MSLSHVAADGPHEVVFEGHENGADDLHDQDNLYFKTYF